METGHHRVVWWGSTPVMTNLLKGPEREQLNMPQGVEGYLREGVPTFFGLGPVISSWWRWERCSRQWEQHAL